jgi:hypothetical protein
VAGPDILDSGPSTPRRSLPRWPVAALVAVVAVVLAVRAAPGPEPAPPPPAPVVVVPTPPLTAGIASVAAGPSLWALASRCDRNAVQACQYQLFRRQSAWTGVLTFEDRSTNGLLPQVLVGADGEAVVLDPLQQWAYARDGSVYTRRTLRVGAVVDTVPPGGILLAGLCPACTERLMVLDAGAGRLHPLRAQPVPSTLGLDQQDATIWVLAGGEEPLTAAVSRDRGRTWRRIPVPRTASDGLRIATAPDGGAYVIGTRRDQAGNNRLAGIWQVTGTSWRQLRPATAPTSVRSVIGGARPLLVVDAGGSTWRLGPDESFTRRPDPGPVRPGEVSGGPTLIAVPRGDLPDRLVLTSGDDGTTWTPERLP